MRVEEPGPAAPRRQRTLYGWGATNRMQEILAAARPRRVVVVAGPTSYRASGAAATLDPILAAIPLTTIERSDAYPTLEDVTRGRDVLRAADPDLLVAVGGGAVLDLAKSIRASFAAVGTGPSTRLELDGTATLAVPLVAIPTTAGTGAETTQFAVLYVDGIKHSLDHPTLRPDIAVIDPALTASVGPRSTAASGMDALAQGIESIWSVASTAQSRRAASRAVRRALGCLEDAVRNGARPARMGMSMAAHLSGRAINVTRTTACHAASYPLTARHGIPHGHAVALTLPAMLEFNAGATPDDVNDPGGVDAVQSKVALVLRLLGAADPAAGRRRLLDLMRAISLETTLAELGIHDLAPLVAEGFNPDRAGNNPRRLTPEVLHAMLAGTW